MQNIYKTNLLKKRKQILTSFQAFLCKINTPHDFKTHKILLSDVIQTDQFNQRKSQEFADQIPLQFNSISHYVELWQKLFQEQTKCQIYASIIQEQREYEQFQIVEMKDCQNQPSMGFKLLFLQRPTQMSQLKALYLEGTIVILSPKKVTFNQIKPQKNCIFPHLIGLVVQGQQLIIKTIFNESVESRHFQDWKQMKTTKKCYIKQICPSESLKRQFYTLSSLSFISQNFMQRILRPQKSSKQMVKKFNIPQKLESKLSTIFDKSQYSAINECLKQQGITLINGPPGTGKSKIILGILSVLLNSEKKSEQETEASLLLNWKKYGQVSKNTDKLLNPWLYQGYTDWRNEPYIQNQDDPLNLTNFYHRCDITDNKIILNKKDKVVEFPKKILICSSSSTSIDQIISKIIQQKLINKNGKQFLPNIVRICENDNQQLKQYSLNNLSQKLSKINNKITSSQSKQNIIHDYQLIFSTLLEIGNQEIASYHPKFDTVIIDDAQQSTQISNLIPLIYGCQRLILIGDPNQLPAKVFAQKSQSNKYNQSLLQRMMRAGYPFSTLKTQYRIHPTISSIIGQNFYKQQFNYWQHLMEEQPIATPSAFMIFHIEQAPQLYSKKSFRNEVEAKAVKDFAISLTKYYNDIAIISPYSQQVELLHSLLDKNKKLSIRGLDELNQKGWEVVLFSSVRSKLVIKNNEIKQSNKKTIGLLENQRIINTILSKSNILCIIFGNINKLNQSIIWKNIIKKCLNQNKIYQYKIKQKKFIDLFKQNSIKYLIKSIQ